MAYSSYPNSLTLAFDVDPAVTDKTKGQLLTFGDQLSAPSTDASVAHYPLECDHKEGDPVAGVGLNGVHEVYVEAFAGIAAGQYVGLGATGLGVAAYAGTGRVIGIALKTPSFDGELIPVLIQQSSNTTA